MSDESVVKGHATKTQAPDGKEQVFYLVTCSCGMVPVSCKDAYSAKVIVRIHLFYQSCYFHTSKAQEKNGGWIPVFSWDDVKPSESGEAPTEIRV